MTTKTKKIHKVKPYQLLTFEDRESWHEARAGKVTGTRLGGLISLRGNGYKKAFWEMIAEQVALPADGENVMDRGLRLEEDAID